MAALRAVRLLVGAARTLSGGRNDAASYQIAEKLTIGI
jgi:hypothetical protein